MSFILEFKVYFCALIAVKIKNSSVLNNNFSNFRISSCKSIMVNYKEEIPRKYQRNLVQVEAVLEVDLLKESKFK